LPLSDNLNEVKNPNLWQRGSTAAPLSYSAGPVGPDPDPPPTATEGPLKGDMIIFHFRNHDHSPFASKDHHVTLPETTPGWWA